MSANPGLEALFSSYIKAGQEVPAWILETYCRPPAITTAGVAPAAASSASSLSSVSSFASNLPGNLASREVNSVVAGAAKSALNQERITEFMGGVFEDRTSAYTAVQLLSTMQGHKGKQDPSISGKAGFTVVCSSAIESFKVPKMSSEGLGVVAASGEPVLVDNIRRVATPCGFCVKVNKRQAGTWAVSKTQDVASLSHNPMCGTSEKPSSNEIAHTLRSVVSNNRTVPGKAIAGDERSAGLLNSNTSCKVNKGEYQRMMRAARQVRNGSEQEYVEGYSKIPEYIKQFTALNPNSAASYEVDRSGVFLSMFFYLGPVDAILAKAGFPTLAVDGTHSKHVYYRFNGLALFLVGRTSNNQLLVLAFMICDKENSANYTMFARKCKNAGLGALLDNAANFDGQKVSCRGHRDKG